MSNRLRPSEVSQQGAPARREGLAVGRQDRLHGAESPDQLRRRRVLPDAHRRRDVRVPPVHRGRSG